MTLNDLERRNGHYFADKCQSTPTKHDGRAVLFAVAELLVMAVVIFNNRLFNTDVFILRRIMTSKIETKIFVTRCVSRLKICPKNAFAAGALPRTPLGSS